MMINLLKYIFLLQLLFSIFNYNEIVSYAKSKSTSKSLKKKDISSLQRGNTAFIKGNDLADDEEYQAAADSYWEAVLLRDIGSIYTVEEAIMEFFKMYRIRNIPHEGSLFIAKQYLMRNEINPGITYLKQTIEMNPKSIEAHILMAKFLTNSYEDANLREKHLDCALELAPNDPEVNLLAGNVYFEAKSLTKALYYFEKAVSIDPNHNKAAANAIYLRQNLCVWGKNGLQYDKDMKSLVRIIENEEFQLAQMSTKVNVPVVKSSTTSKHNPQTHTLDSSIHPHMALAYDIPTKLKLLLNIHLAEGEKKLALSRGLIPTDHTLLFGDYKNEFKNNQDGSLSNTRIRVGYVCASFKSKAISYLTQDLFRFHDRSKFDIYVFSTSGPDNPYFISTSMRGVDWRQKIVNSVENFIDCSSMSLDDIAELIKEYGIHILLNWDGYAHNGIRKDGLFALKPAPLQITQQEYVSTTGEVNIDYIVTDQKASPIHLHHLYTEKFLYMPHTFLINSFAYQENFGMTKPKLLLDKSNNPKVNACGGKKNSASVVFCNFNKHLKIDPHLFMNWLDLLENIPDSYLCLLEYPKESTQNILDFTKEYDLNYKSEKKKKRKSLQDRVKFLPFVENPYDNQARYATTCSIVLDTLIYNAHTTALDALWGGVPLVTLGGDKEDMAARVGISTLTTLGLPELIANDQNDYNLIATKLATNNTFYSEIRGKIIDTILSMDADSTIPKNPLWDLERYVGNLESGFELIWNRYLNGDKPDHIVVIDKIDEVNNIKIMNQSKIYNQIETIVDSNDKVDNYENDELIIPIQNTTTRIRRRRIQTSNDRIRRRRKLVNTNPNQCNYNGEICSIDNTYNNDVGNDKTCTCKCSCE